MRGKADVNPDLTPYYVESMQRDEPITTARYSYIAVFEPAEGGGYVVRFPSIPGLITEGETLDETRAMAQDALRCLVESHAEDGLPLPSE